MMQKPPRPIGITLLAIIEILIGVLGLLASIAIIGVSALFATIPTIGAILGTVGLVIGGIFLVFSLIWLATGVGFLHGRGWAWNLGMFFTVISILGAAYVAYIGIYQAAYALVFWIIMMIYLTRSHVKVFFGKGTTTTYMPAMNMQQTMRNAPTLQSQTQYAPTAPPALQYTSAASIPSSTPPVAIATGKCRSCGMPLTAGNSFCTNCGAKQ
ncbi:MAG TPA: zinc ribbon domain-containing protein [Candidatus Bathyarchaeia archaeon]|nr:zinc ribbon domain-containing protein [Candidatus Bathyarchaeia archaeon]